MIYDIWEPPLGCAIIPEKITSFFDKNYEVHDVIDNTYYFARTTCLPEKDDRPAIPVKNTPYTVAFTRKKFLIEDIEGMKHMLVPENSKVF